MATFEYIIVESKGAVGVITLNRPKMLNALSFGVFGEIAAAVDDLEADDKIGCILLTGSEKAFAASADIKEMQPKTFIDMFSSDFASIGGDRVANCRKPTIAAVSGYALGGGCELAMMCDIIIASDTAKFGQPEIKLGIIPGAGGTQRLPRAVSKAKAMDMVLTARMMDAAEAERAGLVSRVVPAAKLLDEAVTWVRDISGQKPVVTRAKKAISNFKLRENAAIGCKTTLRGRKMWEFFDRLISIAIPRIRDFRGLSRKSFDGQGNYTLGIKEQIVFLEIDRDKASRVSGMDISICTSASNNDEGLALLEELGMPFRK